MRIEQQPDASRYVGFEGDEIACALDYADDGAVVSMTRTFTNPSYRGRGLAAEITEHAVAEAARADRKVRPMCWYVAEWFDKHPEQAHLIA